MDSSKHFAVGTERRDVRRNDGTVAIYSSSSSSHLLQTDVHSMLRVFWIRDGSLSWRRVFVSRSVRCLSNIAWWIWSGCWTRHEWDNMFEPMHGLWSSLRWSHLSTPLSLCFGSWLSISGSGSACDIHWEQSVWFECKHPILWQKERKISSKFISLSAESSCDTRKGVYRWCCFIRNHSCRSSYGWR